jgi:hypothetical protein
MAMKTLICSVVSLSLALIGCSGATGDDPQVQQSVQQSQSALEPSIVIPVQDLNRELTLTGECGFFRNGGFPASLIVNIGANADGTYTITLKSEPVAVGFHTKQNVFPWGFPLAIRTNSAGSGSMNYSHQEGGWAHWYALIEVSLTATGITVQARGDKWAQSNPDQGSLMTCDHLAFRW